MAPPRIDGPEQLEEAFRAPLFLLFKHSQTCPISSRAFGQYGAFAADRPEVATAWIDVVAQRPLARDVAERTGVRHESPQAILLRAGRPVWHASHHAITAEALAEATAQSP